MSMSFLRMGMLSRMMTAEGSSVMRAPYMLSSRKMSCPLPCCRVHIRVAPYTRTYSRGRHSVRPAGTSRGRHRAQFRLEVGDDIEPLAWRSRW